MVQLIMPKNQRTSPQIIRDALLNITHMMAKTNNASDYFFYVYYILCGVDRLLQRYETCCRETILLADLEKDESVMRNEIIKLQKQTLHDELFVPRCYRENMDI